MEKKHYPLLFAIVLLIFYLNTLRWLFESWMYNPYYSHGFLIPLISAFFIWKKKSEISGQGSSQELGFYIIVAALLLQGISFFWTVRFLSGISLILSITGVIIFLYGKDVMQELAFPVFFLIFMVPVPINDILTPPIQALSAVCSAKLASLVGVPAYTVGYEIFIPSGTFEVGLPCSGLRSIISLMVIAVLFAYILEGPLIMKAIIVLSSLPLAVAGNIMRITSVLLISDRYGTEIAMRFFHDLSSVLLFSISLIGLFMIGRCFGRLRFRKIL